MLGLQVARQVISLLGGGGSRGGRGGYGIPFSGGSATDPTAQAIAELTRALGSLLAAETANTSAITANTAAARLSPLESGFGGLLGSAGGESGGLGSLLGGGGGAGIFGNLLGGFGSLLGLGALAAGLFDLFSGPSPRQLLNPYIPPIPQTLEVTDAPGFPVAGTSADGAARIEPNSGNAPATSATHITVNVSAMDAQSFQDNAPALASAVRTAMLNLHPINQLIRESL